MIKAIAGKNINLRDIEISDAQFVLDLRTNDKKSLYLHKTDADIQKQINYINKYKTLKNEWYFIIEDKNGKPLGTVRIYDVIGDSFCWGSWLIVDNAPSQTALESALLIYDYAFDYLNFNNVHFDVRKGNVKVQRFHELFGAQRTGETELDILYKYDKETYKNISEKLKKAI